MKRSFLTVAFVAALVCALTFFFAPAANASSITLQPGETLNITADAILDLAGNSGSVHVADGVKLTVIDSANTGLSGEGAGKLTVLSGEVAAEAEDASGRRFLKLQNADGTFSFHPFYVTIKQVGINTYMNALCVQAMFVANEATQQAITTGVVYGDGALTNAAPTYDYFSFEDGVMYAYFDLIGSLDSQAAMEKVKSFRAYITVGGETIYSKTIATVSPLETLNTVSAMFGGFTEKQQNSLLSLIDRNPQLHEVPAIAELIRNKDLPVTNVEMNTETIYVSGADMEGNFVGELPLAISYTFTTSAEFNETYNDWYADFVITLDRDVSEVTVAGWYEAVEAYFGGWLIVSGGIPGNYEIGLIEMCDPGTNWTYQDIQQIVSVFKCGVFDEVGGADEGATIRVELRLTNPENAGDIRVLGVIEYTFQ